MVAEGEVDDLEGLDEPEEGEGDIVDFELFEQLVVESEKPQLEFAPGGVLLWFHVWWWGQVC